MLAKIRRHFKGKRDFEIIYEKMKGKNPILYQCIFESLSQNKRQGFLKIIHQGYFVPQK